MNIDTKLLKDLRERTGAGIMDCKKALEENNSDIEAAAKWLREKGIAKAVKKASRISAEGVFNVLVNGNEALVYEVNCETDFVAKNEKFNNFVNELGKVLVASGAKCTDCAMEAKNEKGETVKDMLLGFIAVIGENITLRNVQVITKADNQEFGVYKHNGGKIAVVTVVEGADSDLAKKVAMHVCANDPRYLDRNSVDPEYLANEREILTKEAKEENPNKPEQIIERMIEGRIQKGLKEICLMDQAFLMDPNITVEQYLKNNGAKLVSYSRNVVGAGIEKKQNNFVDEVYSQMNN